MSASVRPSIVIIGVLMAAALAACAPATPSPASPSPLAPPTILAAGVLAQVREADPSRTYTLTDGRALNIDMTYTRDLFPVGGGPGNPFVWGQDATGAFVALFAQQGGLPPSCHIMPMTRGGTDRGAWVEIAGVLWQKAASFRSEQHRTVGAPYSRDTQFCFNDEGRVTSTLP